MELKGMEILRSGFAFLGIGRIDTVLVVKTRPGGDGATEAAF
jgi:hypothetical protein